MTVFSFHPVKHLTTGEGGMVTTDNPKYAETLRRFRNHGISSETRQRQASGEWFYEMVLLVFTIVSLISRAHWEFNNFRNWNRILRRRREIAARYNAEFSDMPGVLIPQVLDGIRPARHLYPLRLQLERLRAGRGDVFRALRAENIGVNVHYIPVHRHPYYRDRFGYKDGAYPIAEDAYERLISLPMFHGMSDGDVEDVICATKKVLAVFSRLGSKLEY